MCLAWPLWPTEVDRRLLPDSVTLPFKQISLWGGVEIDEFRVFYLCVSISRRGLKLHLKIFLVLFESKTDL